MEQTPVHGHEALAPPSADVAHQYLREATSVAERREHATDRRLLARLQILNAAVMAVCLTVFAVVLGRGDNAASQAVLFAFLIWGQLASGMAQRSGMQWRMSRSRWPLVAGASALLAIAVFVLGVAVWVDDAAWFVAFVPGTLVLVGFGGYGVLQLARAWRDPKPRPEPRRRLTGMVRAGTILVGASLGALTLLLATPDGVVKSVLLLLVMLLLVAWIAASRTDLGLPAIGAAWRWPHVTAFALAASALVVLALIGSRDANSVVVPSALVAGGALLLSVAVSFAPGRALRV